VNRLDAHLPPRNIGHKEQSYVNRFSFSGHETFPLRVAWLPKAIGAVSRGQDPFSNPRDGMRILGLGKNMVTALQCWSNYIGVIERDDGRLKVTKFGEIIFGAAGMDLPPGAKP
jgi:hypothetical protein